MNIMMESARRVRRLPNFFTGLIIAMCMIMFSAVGILLSSFINVPDYISLAIFQLGIGTGVASFVCILYVKYIERRDYIGLGLAADNPIMEYMKGVALGGLVLIAIYAISVALGGYEMKVSFEPSSILPVILILLGYVVQGFTEELIFRGWLQPLMTVRYGRVLGVLLSSLAFAIAHGINPGMTFFSVANIFLIGMLLGLIVMYTGNLWMAAAFHTIWNWLQGSVLGISVSGSKVVSSLLNSRAIGHDVISGGGFGLEGSVVTTVILVIVIAEYISFQRRKKDD